MIEDRWQAVTRIYSDALARADSAQAAFVAETAEVLAGCTQTVARNWNRWLAYESNEVSGSRTSRAAASCVSQGRYITDCSVMGAPPPHPSPRRPATSW
jgi:hypothetical protein